MAWTIGDVCRKAEARGIKLYVPANERADTPAAQYWVTEHDGALVRWPALDGGWDRRSPYLNGRDTLREVPMYNAAGSGWIEWLAVAL